MKSTERVRQRLTVVDVVVALVLFCEENGDRAIPVKTMKSLLEHYNILDTD